MFDILSKDIQDFKQVHNKIADDFYEEQKQVFLNEGAYKGREKWRENTELVQAIKKQLYKKPRILRASGDFEKSMTIRGDKNAVLKITNKTLEIDSLVMTKDKKHKLVDLHAKGWHKPEIRPKKASVLKFKGPNGDIYTMKSRAVDVPKRPPIVITPEQRTRWVKFYQVHVHETIEESKKKSERN